MREQLRVAAQVSAAASAAAPSKPKKGKAADVAEMLVTAIQKRLGPKSQTVVQLVSSGTTAGEVTEWITSGFSDIDRILGGGWAVGRCSELFGEEACGKSALAHVAIREVQKMDGIALLLDYEHALDKKKIKNVGIDETRLIHATPESLEEGWEIVWAFFKQVRQLRREKKLVGPVLVVWDSIAGSIPKAEIEGTMDQQSVGLHARLMSKGCRKATREVSRSRAHLMWINQYRTKIGGASSWGGGPDKDTTGGRAAKFYASQRVSCTRIKRLKPSTEPGTPPSGYLIKCETEKCRLAPPHRRSEWVLDFKEGPSASLTTRHLLQEAKILRPKQGKMKAPWLDGDEVFRLRQWPELWQGKDFRRGAKKALAALVTAGGVHEYLSTKSKKDEEDDEDEDAD
jgi:recombination protein RecA